MIERDYFQFQLGKVNKGQFIDVENADAVNRKTMQVYFTRINAPETVITLCVLRKKGVTLAIGEATMNPLDRYQRMAGNKLAFTRAVFNFVDGIFDYVDDCIAARSLIWEAALATGYFDKPKTENPAVTTPDPKFKVGDRVLSLRKAMEGDYGTIKAVATHKACYVEFDKNKGVTTWKEYENLAPAPVAVEANVEVAA